MVIVLKPVETVIKYCFFVISTWLKPGPNRIIDGSQPLYGF